MIRLQRLEAREFKLLRGIDLEFPPRGRTLIRGPNESGKSTLFEAIFFGLFGQPLVTETSRGRLEDVIRYGMDEAEVVVQVSLDRMSLRIRRVVRRGRPNVASLEILDPRGQHLETVVGVQAVNARVTAELGLDAEALLASCFVEQKKLDRLEGMSRAQREASLMKLLNLDRLVDLEDTLRVRPTDTQQRLELERRHQLAALAAELPETEQKRDALQERVLLHEALAAVDGAFAAMGRVQTARSALQESKVAEAGAARVLAATSSLSGCSAAAEAAAAARERALAALEAAHAARERSAELTSRAVGDPAALVRRAAGLGLMATRIDCLTRVRAAAETLGRSVAAADTGLQRLAAGRQELNDVRQGLVRATVDAQEADERTRALAEDLRAFEVVALLEAWADLDTEDATASRAAAAAAEADAERRRTQRAAELAGAAVAAPTIFAAAAYRLFGLPPATPPIVWAAVVGAFALALSAGLLVAYRRSVIWRDAVANATRLADRAANAPADAAARTLRREALRSRLRTQNAALPTTPQRLEEVRGELSARLAGRTRDSVEAERDQAVREAADTLAHASVLRQRAEALVREYGHVDAAAMGAARDAEAARAVRLDAFADTLAGRTETQAALWAVPAQAQAVARARGAAEEAIASVDDARNALQAALDEAAAAESRAAAEWRVAESAWEEAVRLWGDRSDALTSLDRGAAPQEWTAAIAMIAEALASVGGTDADSGHREALKTTARLGEQADAAERAAAAALTEARTAVTVAGSLPDEIAEWRAEVSPEALVATRAAIASHLPNLPPEHVEEVRQARDRLEERMSLLRHDVARLEADLGLRAGDLDEVAAGREAEAFTRALEVRVRAADMVEEAARSVAAAVLPSTMDYLRRLLPRLTNHRYFDARLTEDYHIEVWDDLASGWRRKAIFSGGAKDQFSLALRLAFALATLPEERGTAPGFLFLDEPLGSFDAERAAALIGVLTDGEVAESFDQVFLVSHLPVGEGLFDYSITMADGQVVEADLLGT